MKFYERALMNIIRQPIKSLILVAVTFILASGIIVSFLIKSAISESTTMMLNRANSSVTLSLSSDIDEKNIKAIGESEYVKYFDYNINSIVNSDDISKYQGKSATKLKANDKVDEYFDSNFTLTGVNDPELLLIKQGKANLKKGKLFSESDIKNESNAAIITNKLAQANNLNVGSTFSINVLLSQDDSNVIKQRTYQLRVKGIIDLDEKVVNIANLETKDEKERELLAEVDKANYQNIILVSNSLTKNINSFLKNNGGSNNQSKVNTTPIYILNSPYNLKNFIEEESLNLPENASFISDYNNIEKSLASTTILNNIASITFITMVFLTITILALIVVLFLVNRKQEFGIYMALGEKKYKTLAQVTLEICLCGLLGFVLAISTSSLLANQVSTSIMKNSYNESSSQENNINMNEIVPYLDDSQIDSNYISSNYAIRISINNVIFIILIGSATLLLSSIGPSIYIMRLNPKDILM